MWGVYDVRLCITICTTGYYLVLRRTTLHYDLYYGILLCTTTYDFVYDLYYGILLCNLLTYLFTYLLASLLTYLLT